MARCDKLKEEDNIDEGALGGAIIGGATGAAIGGAGGGVIGAILGAVMGSEEEKGRKNRRISDY